MSYRACDRCSRFYIGQDPDDPALEPVCRYCRSLLRHCSLGEVRAQFPGPRQCTALLIHEDSEIG